MIDNQRAKWKAKSTSGYWLYGSLEKIDGANVGAVWQRNNERQSALANIDEQTICLSTGVKDSDGHLIYENDFLTVWNPRGKVEHKSFVWFDNGRLAFRIRLSFVTMPFEDIVRQVEQNGWSMKVTGNRFDED
ncbi:MAG: hypothetical protein IJF84_13470 [Thermoguttaceae bacterium]|nr:hypothetical protein [Thermoguttaceae bacterium]